MSGKWHWFHQLPELLGVRKIFLDKFLVCFFYDFDVKYRRKYTGDEKHDEETKERNCFRSCDILPRTTFNFVLIRNLLFTGVVRKNNMR